MSAEVKVPPFPESVEDGTLTAWHKKEGDAVERDEKVADIETDKIVLEVSAPEAGVLSAVAVKEGDSVKPGQVLATIEAGSGKKKEESKKEDEAKEGEPAEEEKAPDKEEEQDAKSEPADAAEAEGESDTAGDARLSPAVRRMVEEHHLDVSKIEGTGRGGVITKADVVEYLEKRDAEPDKEATPKEESAEKTEEPAAKAKEEQAPKGGAVVAPTAAGGRPEKRVPMTRIRARIAERLVEAQHTAAILTTFNEVNMQPIMDLRSRYKDVFEKKYSIKLGFMAFFVKAAVAALKKFPIINATLDGKDIIYHGYYDIGVAVSTDRGLVVPILRDADQQSYAEIEKKIVDFAGRAREGKLTMEDLTGGTFSITNGGIFGSMLSTPILNPPQSAILGMHKIDNRPVAEDGQVVIRPIMYLALSYDHRLVDGRDAVQFLVEIKENLEDPARVLLDM